MGEIADRILRKNKNNISNLPLTISAQSGLIAQNNFFDKQIASQNLSNYLLLYKGDFAYNKSYSNGYPYGAVKRLEKFNCGVVSSLYIAFKPTHVLPNFLAEYYETTKWYVEIYKRAAEGARNHGLLNISATDFFNSDISLPKREDEQEKIGQLFQSLDKTITLHEEKQRQLERLKKALLQKMFADETGYPMLRFKGFTEKWEQVKLSKTSRSYSGGTPKVGVHEYYDGQIPFIRSGEIASKSTESTISETGLNNSSAKLVSKGDILYALYGATSGEVSLSKINGAINQAILAIKPIDGYENYFLMTWLQKEKEQITRTYLQGGQGNLSAKIVMNLVVNIPSLSEQSQIAQIFSKLDKTITLHDKKIQYLKQLKRGLLQKMFV